MTFYSYILPDPDKPGKSLSEHYPRSKLLSSCVISKDVTYITNSIAGQGKVKKAKAYALFDSYLDVFDYVRQLSEANRNFYECIYGHIRQKPHFDLDLQGIKPEEGDRVLAWFLFLLLQVWKQLYPNVELNPRHHLLVYTSHSFSSPDLENNKSSYHVIVDRYACESNVEAKMIYTAVMIENEKTTTREAQLLKLWLDPSVYSSFQNFRMLGCQKIGSGRPKVVKAEFHIGENPEIIKHQPLETPKNPRHAQLIQFAESLISLTNNCTILPRLAKVTPTNQIGFTGGGDIDGLLDDHADYMLNLLHQYFLTFPYADPKLKEAVKENPFTFEEKYLSNNIIPLQRLFPCHCPNCNRVHEGNTSFLHLHPEGSNFGLYYSCGRNQTTRSVYLGLLLNTAVLDLPVGEILEGTLPDFAIEESNKEVVTPATESIEAVITPSKVEQPVIPPRKSTQSVTPPSKSSQVTSSSKSQPVIPPSKSRKPIPMINGGYVGEDPAKTKYKTLLESKNQSIF